jgi:hypothetical protein
VNCGRGSCSWTTAGGQGQAPTLVVFGAEATAGGARALGRAAWLATRLPYLAGSRRHRGQWVSVAGEFLGRLTGAARYRLLDSGRP